MPTEQAYGVIVVYKDKDKDNLFLILQHHGIEGSWTFPKGHHEGEETPKETAFREVEEETGITDIQLIDTPLLREEYEIEINGEKILKICEYFIGFVKDKNVTIQESEIHQYKWATYKEALETIQYDSRKETLKKAQEYLNMVK